MLPYITNMKPKMKYIQHKKQTKKNKEHFFETKNLQPIECYV